MTVDGCTSSLHWRIAVLTQNGEEQWNLVKMELLCFEMRANAFPVLSP